MIWTKKKWKKLKFQNAIYPNENKKQWKNLQNERIFIITHGDKSGAVVIMDMEKFINKTNQQLVWTLQDDPMLQRRKLVNHTIDSFEKKTA